MVSVRSRYQRVSGLPRDMMLPGSQTHHGEWNTNNPSLTKPVESEMVKGVTAADSTAESPTSGYSRANRRTGTSSLSGELFRLRPAGSRQAPAITTSSHEGGTLTSPHLLPLRRSRRFVHLSE